MISFLYSASVQGIDACLIDVEIDISSGLPVFSIVGLPDTSVKESRDRVVSAIKNSGFDFPTKKITVNLAPADIKKEGGAFDLPISLGILASSGIIEKKSLQNFCAIGELSLDGKLRPVKGILPIVLSLHKFGITQVIVPEKNKNEACVAKDIEIYPFTDLKDVIKFLKKEIVVEPYKQDNISIQTGSTKTSIDFSDIKGQFFAKRAAEVACAGGHNMIMVGPPGSGKTMIAKRIPTILPSMSFEESVETTKIWSVSGLVQAGESLITDRPFRSPHHTTSSVALIGGGSYPKPGEVSLAHNGVLFLDELTEFRRDVLEVLRQPLEDKVVTVSRAKNTLSFPASFMLIASMNPCPCGNYGSDKECTCNPYQVKRYRSKISGPLMDRIDIQVEVPALKIDEITSTQTVTNETSQQIKERVIKARNIQYERFKGKNIYCNAQMGPKEIKKYCVLEEKAGLMLHNAIEKLGFSARAYDRILKVARTIADLAGSEIIQQNHIAEAIKYRNLDKYN
ncbi:YifB family Mg chelatase-like AAA ATPase [Candidatus Ruminimicrobiellum ovillum]|uniref:YifB family Mg chelatase-like AAA ATPase n=1 Tax=Candidatus Ruminimicrobiellum ovillum TaxID=1947927 RepID=UPI003559E6C4